jgi:hypothetical protein
MSVASQRPNESDGAMRTAADRRRSVVASAILDHIPGEARRMGFARISLDTGSAVIAGRVGQA